MSESRSSRERGGADDVAEVTKALDRELRRTGSLSTLLNRAVADFAGLHPTDWECLDVLDWTGPMTAGAVAEHLGLTTGAVTGVIDRLERGGWVRRQGDPADRRRVIVVPVEERGRELGAAFAPLAERIQAVTESLSARERRTVVAFLRAVNEAVADATRQFRERTGP